jgi:peptidoglycan/LPS O-acetylase OafA/YrhL
VVAWAANLFFFPQVFGLKYFSSVYWTLAAEVTFYLWVGALIGFGVWSRFRDQIIAAWLMVAVFGIFLIRSGPVFEFLDAVFVTRYTGHFIMGMLLYEIRSRRAIRPFDILVLMICWLLITHSTNRFDMWVTELAAQSGRKVMDNLYLIFAAPTICSLVWWASHIEKVHMPARAVMTMGAMSYPFYLVHADFAFWVRYSFNANLVGVRSIVGPVSEWWLVGIGFVMSVLLSYLIVTALEPKLYKIVKKTLDGLENFFGVLFRSRGVKDGS